LLEAMACGRCVLTLDVGDTGRLIVDGETGTLLPDGQPNLIAQALARLSADDALRARLGEGAKRYADANFWSWDQRLAAELTEVEALAATPPRMPGGCLKQRCTPMS
jgi:glycosyltransferase involved in cell wall biosynthesis